jgi:hypothetical protein
MKLKVWAFGLAVGIVCGLGMLLFGILGSFGLFPKSIALTSEFYIGFSTSILGILLGTIYGFVDGFLGGAIVAWIYNRFAK